MAANQTHDAVDFGFNSSASEDEVRELSTALLKETPEQGKDLKQPNAGEHDDDDIDHDELDAAGGTRDDDDQDDEGTARVDTELRDAPDEAARQRIKAERNRQTRLNQRQRSKLRMENLERQLANANSLIQDQAQRLAQIEGGQRSAHFVNLQQQEQQAQQAEQSLKNLIADATVKGDGNTVAEATAQLVQVQRFRENIASARTQLETEQQQPRRQPMNPRVVEHARAFMGKHAWYKGPNADDEDSQILAVLDRQMVKDGWNPATEAYWNELEARAERRLPHRFGGGGSDRDRGDDYNSGQPQPQSRQPRRSPVVDGGNGSQPNGGKANTQVMRLSPQRVQALKDAGMWDDPVKREKMIKRYRDLDRQQQS